MTLARRLALLEQAADRRRPPTGAEALDDAGKLRLFERLGACGAFASEPDFPAALDAFCREVEHGERPLLASRSAYFWLVEMLQRVREGIPAVTTAEFGELAAWLSSADQRLYEASLPSQILDLGDGRNTTVANLRYGVWLGPRASGVTEMVADLRRLRERFGDMAITTC